MVLTVNVSNTALQLGAYEDERLVFCASLHSSLAGTADEYAVRLRSILSLYERTPQQISGVILSCVVPPLLARVRSALERLYAGRIYTVGPGLRTGLSIRTDDPSQLGSEIVCCAVAALSHYQPPCVIISLDTAISMTALDASGVMRGGAIMPGVRTGMEALCARTAQLPQVDLTAPVSSVLGTNSTASLQAGAVLGTASMLDGMIERFAAALGQAPTCVATGELAPVVLPHCTHKILCHEHLVLEGLYLLYQKNAK